MTELERERRGRYRVPIAAACAAAALVLGTASAGAIDRDAHIYYVEDFDGAGACGGDDLSWGYDSTDYLRDATVSWGWASSVLYGNQGTDFQDIADVDEDANGADHLSGGFDAADVAMLYSHGGYGGCSTDDAWSSFKMGAANGNSAAFCTAFLGTSNAGNDIHWGDTQLNMVIVDTCNSLRKCVANDASYYMGEGNFSLYLGYHGISWDGSGHTNRFENYVDSSELDGAGDNWVDEMTSRPIGWDNDECATAISYGANESDADYTYDFGGLGDWKVPSSHTSSWFYYIGGCNAEGAEEL
ncbi:MAG: hypothetical protein E6J90_11815 [Deltaproteobacteria bacterium]|nr:MAG: hypothetical protein E6J91_45190 [Deltaproteobacteria bacterium]TMQ22854.1 MAG: hypothetical protein E6J90_11815 [Deltaproteobacteria bacterium]